MDHQELIRTRALSDMSEGVLAIRFDGTVELANDAALAILARTREALVGRPFARSFFADEANDAFTQCVLDAIYDKTQGHERYVPYTADGKDFISGVVLRDDTVETPEGIAIGSKLEDVKKKYNAKEEGSSINVYSENCRLLIIFDNGVVSSIQYIARSEK